MEKNGKITGVKMEWIGGLMVKIHYSDDKQPTWLIVGDHPELFNGDYEIPEAIKRALDWWMGKGGDR
jgi:hypothetical protein